MIPGADITHCNSPLLFSPPEGTWDTLNFHNKSIVSHSHHTHAVSVYTAICAPLVWRFTFPESLEVIMCKWGPSDSWLVSLGFPVNLHGDTWNSAPHKQLKMSVEGFGFGAPQPEGQSGHGMPRQRGGICPPWFTTLAVQIGFQMQLPFTMSGTLRFEISRQQSIWIPQITLTTNATVLHSSKGANLGRIC